MTVADDRHDGGRPGSAPRAAPAKAAEPSPREIRRLKIGGIGIRSLFLLVLAVVTLHVSAPQTSTGLWPAHLTFADWFRAGIGWAACLWLVIAIFHPRKELEAYRTWLIIGPPLAALLLVCAIAWW